ncbi:MAG: DNA-directed RNA polymerase subunit beta, partial [Candidatus Dadabacteria bacterium]|nr:DNA-directed RNA polymerase subunit beta [Candidatus Dadabacteria bacterium]
ALMEEDYVVAQANAPLEEDGSFKLPFVSARGSGEFMMVEREKVEFMDVSPSQLVSVSASLIPFLEHDDANRALMGSNMQRQAVPLIKSTSPLVGTGFESKVAKDSGVTVVARRDGVVESVDAVRIVVKSTERSREGGVDIYNLIKFHRSNQSSCWNQNPIVRQGQRVKKGQVIADGCSTDHGELALGQNMVVAFMPWGGYNFEDAILISERVVKDDAFTSIHIEEFECTARETKLGREDITRDIPNVSEESLRNLDESGIIMIGAEVEPGDILVGKISPKAETQLSPEERLLRAIFGDKAGDVKDSSLKVPSGVHGTVIDVETLVSRSVDKDDRSKFIENYEISKLKLDKENEVSILRRDAVDRVKHIVLGKTSLSKITVNRKTVLKSGQKITEEILDAIPLEKLVDVRIKGLPEAQEELVGIVERVLKRIEYVSAAYEQRMEKLKKPDELPPGVLRVVKVRIAVKRKLQVGDKMAGRHGNKGVVSKILPQEDMPYLSDGRPVDMVLNPLGVPSRMNVGQILETHLGWGGRELGRQLSEYVEGEFGTEALRDKLLEIYSDSSEVGKLIKSSDRDSLVELVVEFKDGIPVKSPVFDGADEAEISRIQKLAGIHEDGKTILFDGQTGEPFDQKVCVGIMYMLKLHHLVEEKIHARAIGPYSLVTQQPLGGKAHFGGQRLGEMEVWALEAYGAAYTLQEFVTIKSDDVAGRTRIFDSIVRGDMNFEPGLPESFKVLRKELQALGLDVDLIEEEAEIDSLPKY